MNSQSKDRKVKSKWWLMSSAVSALLIVVLVFFWIRMNGVVKNPKQLYSDEDVENYLKQVIEDSREIEDFVKVKTGLFIQSFEFSNFNEVHLTGYVWQKYRHDQLDTSKCGKTDIGVIFPEQVNAGAPPREVYRYKQEGNEVVGWYFEVLLRQPFDYTDYPFDHKTVWVRMWPECLVGNIVLVPDFDSYASHGQKDIFGMDEDIVLGVWEKENTYFDFIKSSYNLDLGLKESQWQDHFPELSFNILVKRKFSNAFIVYLLPLFLVSILLFSALLIVSNNEDLRKGLGFSTSGFLGAMSGLFFVVMLGHIQLRSKFAGSEVVYIEMFYILMYAALVVSMANTYLFSIPVTKWTRVIHYQDNLLPKVLYWPLLFGCLILITWFYL